MKKTILLLIAVLFLLPVVSWGQLLEENFNYTTGYLTLAGTGNVSGGNWVNFSGTTYMSVVNGSLSYSSYSSSNIGNKLNVTKNVAEDAYRIITTQSPGTSVYVSFLLEISDLAGLSANTSTTGDYGFALLTSTSTTTLFGRVSFRLGSSGGFQIGLRATSSNSAAVWNLVDRSINTTYLIVLKYQLISGNTNDIASLWINPDLSGSEPVADLTQTSALTTDPSDIGRIAWRNGTNSPIGYIDGIRVATTWADAPLPVELTSFTSNVNGNKVELNWRTATEVNNYGFEIERLAVSNQQFAKSRELNANSWVKIGFVEGNGNSNSPKSYSFTDEPTGGKEFKYRLKQIDIDGTFEYSDIVTAVLDNVSNFALEQNFPNPFNPTTKISYTIPERVDVKLKVYDMIAQQVAELVNSSQEAGHYQVTFDGSNLPSGVYFYKLEAGNFVEVKKFMLVK